MWLHEVLIKIKHGTVSVLLYTLILYPIQKDYMDIFGEIWKGLFIVASLHIILFMYFCHPPHYT